MPSPISSGYSPQCRKGMLAASGKQYPGISQEDQNGKIAYPCCINKGGTEIKATATTSMRCCWNSWTIEQYRGPCSWLNGVNCSTSNWWISLISAAAGDLWSPRYTYPNKGFAWKGAFWRWSIVKCQWTPAPAIRGEEACQQLHTLAILRLYRKRVVLVLAIDQASGNTLSTNTY